MFSDRTNKNLLYPIKNVQANSITVDTDRKLTYL